LQALAPTLGDKFAADSEGINDGYPVLVWQLTPEVVGEPGSGDLDGDGYVTVGDALVVARAVVGVITLTPAQFAAVDLDGDGSLTMSDAIAVIQRSIGL
jgi:hypothetical protein